MVRDIRYSQQRNYIAYWRKKRGIAHASRLAQIIGVSHSTVLRWEEQESNPREDHLGALEQALGATRQQLLFGPGHRPDLLLPAETGFADDAAPFIADIPGIALSLDDTETPYQIDTNVLSRARGLARLAPGDIAIFDIGERAVSAFQAGEYPDGTAVIAQAHDDARASAATIVRQWVGDVPGLLLTNRPGSNEVLNLQQRGDVRVMGVLTRSITPGAGYQPPALPSPKRNSRG